MPFTESFEQASGYARQALERLLRDRVPPNPDSFAVWYAYFAGQHPDLVKAIDRLAADDRAIDDATAAELHERFLASDEEEVVLQRTGVRLQEMLTEITATLEDASEGTGAYGKSLDGLSARIRGAKQLSQLRELISALAQETRTMAERNQRLGQRMKRSSQEVAQLRQALEDVRREASTDALTGLRNRRYLEMAMRQAVADAGRAGHTLSMVMLDIDHFKQFNDNFGHPIGDQVLRLVGRVIGDAVSPGQTAGRYGGEEFVMVLPMVELDQAAALAERVRGVVGRKQVIRRDSGEALGSIRLSAGAGALRTGETMAAFLRRVDMALYRAKSAGRDRLEIDRGAGPEAAGAA